jgi:putative 2OG-Fe(II) oxygenase
MEVKLRIEEFKQQGFVNLGSTFLDKEQIDELCTITKTIFETMPNDHPDVIRDDGVEGVLNLPLYDLRVGLLVNKILSKSAFRDFLNELLGHGYKIWDISMRRSSPGNKGLYLHQDGVGQINMAINLDDNCQGKGSTALLPSSHVLKSSIRKLKAEVPPVILNWLSFLFVPLAGSKGDISLFSNRVWHGRFNNLEDSPHDVLFIGFFPEGYSYSRPLPEELINYYQGTALGELLATPQDFEGAILSNCECREAGNIKFSKHHGYSLEIENSHFLSNQRPSLGLVLSVMVLRAIMWLGGLFRNFRKVLQIQ